MTMIKKTPDGRHYVEHPPGDRLDYFFDWTDRLSVGEALVSSVWQAPAGVTLSDETIEAGNITVVFAAGGVLGQKYKLINTVTTDSIPARIMTMTLELRCLYL